MAGKKNEAYIEFKANTSEFQKGIKQMNAELKNASNALRLNSTQLKGAGDSVDLLSERQNILQNELEASKQKVELTEKSLAECKATLGENSKEYASLSNAVIAAKNQQQAIQNELEQTAEKLTKIETENKQAATAFGQLSDKIEAQENDLTALKKQYSNVVLEQGKGSKEAQDLAKQIDTLSSELNENKKELKQAETAADKFDNTIDELSDSAKDAGDGFTVFKGALSGIVSSGFTGLVNGAKSAISSVAGLEEETREYRGEMGKLAVAFDEGGFTADQAKNTYKDFYAVLGDEGQSVEAVSHLAKLTNSQKELDKWTTICTGVYGTFGASLPIEGLTEAANETAKVGQVTGPLADALNWAGVSEDKFNESLEKCSNEQERQQLITETLSGLYSDAAKKYKETNGAVIEANRAQSDYTDTLAAFGEKAAPVTTAVKEGFNGLLGKVLELVEGTDVQGFASSIESGFATVKDTVLPAVVEGFGKLKEAWQWLSEHTGLLATIAATIGVVTVAITAYNVVQGIKTAMDAANVTTVWALVAAHIAQAAAAMAAIAPYILIVAAIAAVIAIIVLCVKNWDKIKEKITEVAQKVKEKVIEIKNQITEKLNAAKQKAVEIFENIKKSISDKITAAKNKVSETFNNIKSSITEKINAAKNAISSVFNSIKSTMSNVVNNAKNAVVNTFQNLVSNVSTKINSMKSKVTSVFNSIKSTAVNVWNGIKSTISNVVKTVASTVSSVFSTIKSTVNNVLNSFKSLPSQMLSIGTNLVQGLWNGINNAKNWVLGKIQSFGSSILSSLKSFFGIHSPSKVMQDQVGKNIALGVIAGVNSQQGNVSKSAKELSKIYVDEASKKAEALKDANKLTEADEVAFWAKIQSHCEKGTEAYITATKQLTAAKKQLNSDIKELDKQYAADVKKIQTQLKEDIQSVTNAYNQAIKDRKAEITKSLNLFEAWEGGDVVNKKSLTANLQSQVKALEEWDNTLDVLSQRKGVKNSGLLEELESMGVDALGTIKELNNMSDKELQKYIKLYEKKNKIALERAEAENADLKAQSEKEIKQLTKTANKQLNKLEETYTKNLKKLGVTAKDQSRNIGKDIVKGLKNGIKSENKSFKKFLKDFFNSITTTATDALDIHSPSRVFSDLVGFNIPAGIAKGIENNTGSVISTINKQVEEMQAAYAFNKATAGSQLPEQYPFTLETMLNKQTISSNNGLADVLSSRFDNAVDRLAARLEKLEANIYVDGERLASATATYNDTNSGTRALLAERGLAVK